MKANGQISKSAKAMKINCTFEQTNLSNGVSDDYWVYLDVLAFYVFKQIQISFSECSGENFGHIKF